MRRVWLPVSIVTGLLLLLTYLFVQSKSPDLALRARMQEAMQAMQLHDTELTRDVLLARAGLVLPENPKQLKSLTMLTAAIIVERGLQSSIHRAG